MHRTLARCAAPFRTAPKVAGAVALACAAVLSACGDNTVRGTSGSAVVPLAEPAPPASVLGLTSQLEDVAKLVATENDLYVDAVAIYSLRQADLVQATLQISRFNDKARPKDDKFRSGLVTNLGGREGTPTTVGKDTVFVTQGRSQRIAVWFHDDLFFILTTRDDYDMPRALLREALQIGVAA